MFTARYELNVYIKIEKKKKKVCNIGRPYLGGSQACETLSSLSAVMPVVKVRCCLLYIARIKAV